MCTKSVFTLAQQGCTRNINGILNRIIQKLVVRTDKLDLLLTKLMKCKQSESLFRDAKLQVSVGGSLAGHSTGRV